MPSSFALDSNFDIASPVGGGIEKETDPTALARDRIRIILKTIKATVPLHPGLGLPVQPMVRSRSVPFIQGAIERAILEQEPDAASVDFLRIEQNPSIGEVSFDVSVRLHNGVTITEEGVNL